MFDFPANPTNGQLFTPPGGPTYTWKAPTWMAVGTIQTPPGTIIMTARNSAPTGFLKANGALVSRVTYADLFAAIGTTWGVGDGSTTFAIPDLRGEFPRFWDDARGIDAARAFASAQGDGVKSHTHTLSATSAINSVGHTHTIAGNTGGRSVAHTHNVSGTTAGVSAYHTHVASGTTSGVSANHTHAISGTTGTISVNHTHTFSDTQNTGTASANHAHNVNIYGGTGGDTVLPAMSGDTILQGAAAGVAVSSGAAHVHGVTVSGSTGTVSANHTHTFAATSGNNSVSHTHTFSDTTTTDSVNHTHTFSDTSDGESVDHSHAISFTSGAISANHTHTVDGTTAANTSATTENRPRNVALLACIKY